MKLTFDHNQRLNLVTILGEYDVKGRELHALWHLQDLLDLDDAEKQSIDLREQMVNGQKVRWWSSDKSISARSFDLSEADVDRIRKALEEFPRFRASRDRFWVEPLKEQLNGANLAPLTMEP